MLPALKPVLCLVQDTAGYIVRVAICQNHLRERVAKTVAKRSVRCHPLTQAVLTSDCRDDIGDMAGCWSNIKAGSAKS